MAKAPTTDNDTGKAEKTGKVKPPKPRADETPIETNPVEAHEPYPTGSPPDPEETFERIHGQRPKEE
jgi:hypothetical protein